MGKEKTKVNISISLHHKLIELIEKHCTVNNLKKSKFIEEIIQNHFKKESNEE